METRLIAILSHLSLSAAAAPRFAFEAVLLTVLLTPLTLRGNANDALFLADQGTRYECYTGGDKRGIEKGSC